MQSKSQLEQMLIDISNRANLEFRTIIQSDEKLQRQDTLKGILYIVDQYRQILSKATTFSAQQKARNYHIIYNTISYIIEILAYIQKSSFSFEAIKPLVDCIIAIQSNLVLADIKYLDKRTQIYLFLCKVYEQAQYYQPILMLLDSAIKKYEELKKIYELDPPVEKYVYDILDNNIFILKVMTIKFSIQGNIINANDWKKKTQEQLKDSSMQKKLICLIECLRTQSRKNSNIFNKNHKAFKETLVQQGFDMIKPHLDILSRGLKQMKQKIEFQITFKQKTMTQTLKQEEINQEIKKKRQLVGKHIKESQLKKASKAFPLQYHAQLIYYAYQVKNHKILEQLIRCGMIRVQCRRIQVPYVTDVKIEVSNTPYVNAKQGYDKIPIDLNDANLREQLKKLRKSGKTDPNAKAQTTVIQQPLQGKDAKKGGKQAPPVTKVQQPRSPDEPTQWQLQQINHKYVFMFVKRSYNPQKALYDIKVVLGHQQKGPVGYEESRRIIVPYIQKNEKVIGSQIQQYKGMRESTQLVPYIILSHSQNSLQNEQERKTLITDVEPIIGKNPIVTPRMGYTKLNMDLRQVPEQFIKMPGQSYIYLTYKTDYQFHLSSRMIELFNALIEVQNSYGTLSKNGDLSLEQIDKYLQLSINFSVQKLDQFFITLQENLKGQLGQQFYLQHIDFLTNMVSQIWSRYIQLPLEQIDYMLEQRLNEEIIQNDYMLYKQISNKCKPVFLRGLKVMNLIMINNKRCDIFLLGKISLELIKLLQQNKEFFLASQNAKLAIDRIRMKRDEYLTKSVQAIHDRLLPFTITCDNYIIGNTVKKMKQKFLQQRLVVQKVNKVRKFMIANKDKQLSQQELKQAQLEWKINRVSDEYDETVQKINERHSEFSSLLSAIDFDLTNIYFRVSLKHGDELKRRGVAMTGQFSAGQLTGLADTLVKKLGFLQTKGNVKEKQNLKQLQTTLIKAQKLPPPKPQSSRPQKRLLQQSYKNPYKLSLLLLNLGALNSSNEDKKYYLKESLKALKDCQSLQNRLLENCVENSIFIFSSMFDSQINTERMSFKTRPFNDLFNGTWPAQGDRAPSPILVGKNSSCIYMKLPPFVFRDKKSSKIIESMKLYGKVSANGVDVSTNCDDLMGTGTKQPVGRVIKVDHLQPNNNYCFAVTPLNPITSEIMDIGKTSFDIPTFNPLPVSSIASALAKVAYQINQYDIAQEAARIVVCQFTTQTKIIDTKTNSLNKTLKLKLDENKIQSCSLIQIKSVAQSLYILALCEKKKLQDLKRSYQLNPKPYQQKQREILNLLTLCSSLQPALPYPITSISLVTSQLSTEISDNAPLTEGYMLSLFNKEFMSPKIRRFGVAIVRQLMSWGLQNNQISLVRRILYKWATRKWVALGKMIQVPVQEKKDTKKGGKDPKQQVQEQKMIDKFCHYMIEKSPLIMEQFQDSLISTSDEYSDLLTIYTQSVKQSIQALVQSTDNGQQKGQEVLANLTSKIQLSEFMKDTLNSIGKVGNNSKFYLEYNCRLMRKALEISSKNDLKGLAQKIEDFQKGELTEQVKISFDILSLIQEAFENNIQFSPESKNWVKFFMQKTQKKQLQKTIEIYEKYQQKMIALTRSLKTQSFSLIDKTKDYDYQHIWLSQLNHLKAVSLIMSFQSSNNQSFKVSYKIKPIYTEIEQLSLQNLSKKQKQVQIMGSDKVQFDAQSLSSIEKILKYLTEGMYSAFCVENWVKFTNLATLLINFFNHYEITPFYHQNSSKIWVYLSLVGYMVGQMLKKIRRQGTRTFKQRYNKKLQNTQTQSIYRILKPEANLTEIFQPLYDQYMASYFMPELSGSTSKQPWFTQKQYEFLNINNLLQVIVYTVQTLSLGKKNQVIIQILRQFCNATQHSFSLQLLPVLLDSQIFLLNEVQQNIDTEQLKLKNLDQDFENEKKKHKKKRTAQITGQKMQFQIDYEINRNKIIDTLLLLKQQRSFLNTQMQASKTIVNQIQRDCNKAALSQKQQKRYVQQFGQDEENIWKNYQPISATSSLEREGQERSSMNKLNILSKNRKNVLKELISKYDQIYQKLKNNKTSKDTMSQIMNRNEIGNLCYALTDLQSEGDNISKASEYWNDALATIFRKVNPIENYLQILSENEQSLVANIGFKQLLIAIPIIYKVSQFCCYKDLQFQRKTIDFCANVVHKLFLTSLIHPQHILAFANYRLKGFDNGLQKNFYHEEVSVQQISVGLEYFVMNALDTFDNSQIVLALPMIVLYEHLVVDILRKNELAIKAKIMKSLVLTRCGQVKASSLSLLYIAEQKDLPILWLQKSDSLKKQKGENWWPQQSLILESKPFYSPQNKQPIQQIKSLSFPQFLTQQLSIQLPILFNISKYTLLSKIYESQITENFQLNQQRITNLKQIEGQLRESLRKLSVVQESVRIRQQYEELKWKVQRGASVEDQQKIMDKKKVQLETFMKATGQYDDNTINKFLNTKTDIFTRKNLIQHMIRIRFTIYRINQSRNLPFNCFHIIKNGLNVFNRYCYNARRAENGYDPELQTSVDLGAQQTGKKDDKKGGKKESQVAKAPVKQQINYAQEERLKRQMTTKPQRNGPTAYWHLKLTFQMGVLLYRQNNFIIALKIFEELTKNCSNYNQSYIKLFAQTYGERCKLRLGQLNKNKILELISIAESQHFTDEEYVKLVMDFGEIFDKDKKLALYQKGLTTSKLMWQNYGMKKYLQGLLQQPIKKKYAISDELTAQQQDLLKKKTKKVQDPKKGGKDEKKPAKKQDPKKKKQQSKAQYKANMLKPHNEVNLFDDEQMNSTSHFRQYIYDKHPNFYAVNVYNDFGKKYIKCFARYWAVFLKVNKSRLNLISKDKNEMANKQTKKSLNLDSQENYSMIPKLIKIAESYPQGNLQSLMLLKLKSYFEKKQFLYKLQQEYVKSLSKQQIKRIKLPFEDNPLNSRLILLPSYFGFLTENIPLIKSSAQSFKQLLTILPQVPFVLQNDQQLDIIVYQYAQTIQLLLEYSGTLLPKYAKISDQQTVVEEKKMNKKLLTSKLIKLLQFSVDLSIARKRLGEEYYTFSKKELQPSVKIDQDISMDIKNIDKECKSVYPSFLKQSLKPKQNILSLDMLSYLLKIRRESQVMTFSNPLQNTLKKCHRILSIFLSSYKENCIIPLPDLEKPLDSVSPNLVIAKSKKVSTQNSELQSYIYVLGNVNPEESIIYGKFNIEINLLSKLLENCYKIQSKLKQSASLSLAVKERDYKLLQGPFNEILKKMIALFGGVGTSSDPNALQNEILSKNLMKLSQKLIQTLINLFNGEIRQENEQLNKFLKQLHSIKYRLRQDRMSSTITEGMPSQMNEKTIQMAR